MTRKVRAWVVGVLVFVGCEQLVQPVANVNFLTVEQEIQVSEQFAREVESQQSLVRDKAVTAYVSDLGHRLADTLRDREFRYRFRAVLDSSVNAFNIGGGYVYLHTGLLTTAGTEGQVASVVAHEIGHQVYRHVAKAISRDQLFQTLASLAVGQNADDLVQLAAGLGVTTGQLYFGREAERQADDVMVVLMTRAGFHPEEALRMFEKLRALNGSETGQVGEIFSSHPPTSERIKSVRARIDKMDLPPNLVHDSRRFQRIRKKLR
jgi:predicted Zn-dependent protease